MQCTSKVKHVPFHVNPFMVILFLRHTGTAHQAVQLVLNYSDELAKNLTLVLAWYFRLKAKADDIMINTACNHATCMPALTLACWPSSSPPSPLSSSEPNKFCISILGDAKNQKC